ncbi:hypothetical protein CLAIMM_13711 [Cladophialophora immunda]|nr:hypothetical protein CLAIMM_13711 [Cladophialophora immunda]
MASRPRLRSSSRKDSPLSPPKPSAISVVIDAPPNHNKRRTRSSSREVATAQRLSHDLEQPLPSVSEEGPASGQIEDLDSSISDSFEESSTGSSFESLLDALDRDTIIDNLVKLRNDSDAVFSMFDGDDRNGVRDICAKLLQLDPLLRRKLLRREEQLLATMKDGLREINHDLGRPDGVLYLANLALQLVMVLRRSLEERHTYLEFMFNNFPEPFHDLDVYPFSSDTVKGTFHFYTEILTQFYIRQVETKHYEEGFDPDRLLGAVFYDERNKIKGSSDDETYAKAMSRMSSIKSYFDTKKPPWINVEALTQQYPWSDFVVQVVRWSLARKNELDDMIKSRGGIEKLIDSLLAQDFQDEAALAKKPAQGPELAGLGTKVQDTPTLNIEAERVEDTDNKSTHQAQKATTGSLLGRAMRANIDRLKALKAEHSARTPGVKVDHAAPSPPEPEHEISQSPSPVVQETQPAAVDGGDNPEQSLPPATASDEEIVPTQQTNIVLEIVRRQNEQSDKENKNQTAKKASLFDRQEGAERVEWGEPSDNDNTPLPPRQLSKRRLPQTAGDDIGYDEFETDKRATKRARTSGDTRGQVPTTRPSLPAEDEITPTINSQDARLPDESRTVAFSNRGQPSRPAHTTRSPLTEARKRTLPVPSPQPAQPGTQTSPSRRAPLESVQAAKRRPPSSSAPTRTHPESFRSSRPPSEGPPPASQIDNVNREAKERMRMSRELLPAPRGGQVRIAYTEREVNRLMELVELHGTRWARILEEDNRHDDGPMLQGRTQVQLKDKARNIKLDFLKAGRRLPPGFEAVSVGQRQINELRKAGIDYVEGQNAARYTRRPPAANDDDNDADDGDDIQDVNDL